MKFNPSSEISETQFLTTVPLLPPMNIKAMGVLPNQDQRVRQELCRGALKAPLEEF